MKRSFAAGPLARVSSAPYASRHAKLTQTTHQASSQWLRWCPRKRSRPSRAPRPLHLQRRACWCAARVASGHTWPATQYSRHPWAHTTVDETRALRADPNPSATRSITGRAAPHACAGLQALDAACAASQQSSQLRKEFLISRLDYGAYLHRTFKQPRPRGQVSRLPSLRLQPLGQPMRLKTRARAHGDGREPLPAARHGYTVLSRGTPPLAGSSPVPLCCLCKYAH